MRASCILIVFNLKDKFIWASIYFVFDCDAPKDNAFRCGYMDGVRISDNISNGILKQIFKCCKRARAINGYMEM